MNMAAGTHRGRPRVVAETSREAPSATVRDAASVVGVRAVIADTAGGESSELDADRGGDTWVSSENAAASGGAVVTGAGGRSGVASAPVVFGLVCSWWRFLCCVVVPDDW